MEIKVGEYIRTEEGYIGKLYDYDDNDKDWLYLNIKSTCDLEKISINEVVKHSPNIIDLLEIYDYANGNPIITINYKEQYITTLNVNERGNVGIKVLLDRDIKSLVTKEQFKSMEYRLED